MSAATPISPARHFGWLLRREFWEHRTGLLWAPLVAGLLSLALTAIALVTAGVLGRNAEGTVQVDGQSFSINGLDLASLASTMQPADYSQLADVLNMTLLLAAFWPMLVMAFVVFFYCLGALYDDRRDRSILFWKSLPVSDLGTVLSKLATALLVAPLLALVASVVTVAGYMALLMAGVAWAGADPIALVWQPASPLSLIGSMVLSLPAYALWALPTAGWLLLCSAFARRVPFLWAVVPPVLGGALLSASGLLATLGISHSALWLHGIARLLLGTVPGITEYYRGDVPSMEGQSIASAFEASHALMPLGRPALWIGALFGLACIAACVWLRRRSDDS